MSAKKVLLNAQTNLEEVASLVAGCTELEIDCGVLDLSGHDLNFMMKAGSKAGVEHFILRNVCGQNLIGTGLRGKAKISVHGIMGNHSTAFIDGLTIDTYPTNFPNKVWCPGDAQVAIGTSGNPKELNIGGSVDDLFASYAPSGHFRVAGQGGNRCVLRAGAGIPAVWREIDYKSFEGLSDKERIERVLMKYQKRRAKIRKVGWDSFIDDFKVEVERRTPPVFVFGRRVKDYFMEYAQGSIGIVLNMYGFETPVGFYVCSGMTAGKAFIRGAVDDAQLGMRVRKVALENGDRELIIKETKDFYSRFENGLDSPRYKEKLDQLFEKCEKSPEEFTSGFIKIVPDSA